MTHSFTVTYLNIDIRYTLLKTRFFGYISVAQSIDVSSTTFT